MRCFSLCLCCVGFLGLVSSVRSAEDDARAILTRAVKAHGGKEALKKYQAAQSKAQGKITLPGVGEVDFTQELAYQMPDKLRDTLQLDIAGTNVRVETRVNGARCSIDANGKKVEVTDTIKKGLKDAQSMMRAARLAPLLEDRAYKLSLLGEIKVEGKPALGVQVSAKGQKDLNLYFDKKTNLLAKLEYRTIEAGTAKEITEERIIQEYGKKTAEGIRVPKKIVVLHDGKKFMQAEVTESRLFEKLDDSEFEVAK